MTEFRLPPNSRIRKGVTHKAPAGAAEVRTFRIYRFDPSSGENPRVDTFELDLSVACLRDGQQSVVSGRRELSVEGRSRQKIACTDLFGAFFDTTYAFRFGPPSHDVVVARLHSRETGALVAEAFASLKADA